MAEDTVEYGELKSGAKGVMIGEEKSFLQVEVKGKLWRMRLQDLFSGDYLTGWVKVLDLEQLRRARRTKPIRQHFDAHIIEKIIIAIEANEYQWKKREKTELSSENVAFSEDVTERSWALLRDPAFFYKLGKVFDHGFVIPKINKPRFVIGEERNKRVIGPLLIGASKHGQTSLIKLLGESGTAKDTIFRMWLKILPTKSIERSYMTAAAIRYSPDMRQAEVLYIPDTPYLKGEVGRQLRFMRADDGGLISEYATKDSGTGEMTTKVVILPMKCVVTTSNYVTGDTALESGMWTLRTNASTALTNAVKKEKLKLRAGKRPLFPDDELQVWMCAFKLLLEEENQELPTIPYAQGLISLLESERSESRRDPDKLCDLISQIGWMRRFQKDPEDRKQSDIADLYFALQIGLDAITTTIGELDPKERLIFNAVRNYANVTCRGVANDTGIPYKTCYRYLEKLVTKGFLLKEKEKGNNVYSSFSGKEVKESLFERGSGGSKPEDLVKVVMGCVEGFSLSHQGSDIIFSLIDPLSGDEVTVKQNSNTIKTIVKDCEYEYPYQKTLLYTREKVRKVKPSPSTLSKRETDAKTTLPDLMRNDVEPFQSFKVEEIANVQKLTYNVEDEHCQGCTFQGQMHSSLTLKDGTEGFLCKKCASRLKQNRLGEPSLQDKLAQVVSTIVELQRETGMVKKTVVLTELETKHEIPKDEAERFISQLLREAVIFEPREGYLKKT